MKTWIVLIGLVAAPGCGQAMAATDYRCTIERTVAASKSSLSHIFIGKQFTVERQTGVMAGTLKNTYVTAPQVIDYGSTENSFKAVTTMSKEQGAGAGSAIYALTINEHQDGTRKNFIFLQNDEVFLGWCEHF